MEPEDMLRGNTEYRSDLIENSSELKSFQLPKTIPGNASISCSWKTANQFTIFPRGHKVQNISKNQEACDQSLYNIRQDIILFTPIIRKLVNESNGTFLALQKMVNLTKGGDNQIELLKYSRQYRSMIRACLENLQEEEHLEGNEEQKNSLLSCITILYSIECIWHLCEILFIDVIPGDVVLPHLLEWVRFHFPVYEKSAAAILELCERNSENLPEYWDSVFGMIMHGRTDAARALLKLHSHSDSNEFKLVDNALRTMPTYSVYGGISAGEFNISWKHWQLECKSKLNMKCFQSEANLDFVMKLLCGDYNAFERVRSKYESWFDVIGGWLLYTEPTARSHSLAAHAASCVSLRGGASGNNVKQLDVILLAAMELDLHQVIHEIQNLGDNNWFATHITDILFHTGKLKILDKKQVNVTHKLRESMIVEYGSIMMEHQSLWQVGLSYLATTKSGCARAELILPRMSNVCDSKLMKIIYEAKKYNMDNVVREICACASARWLREGRAGEALAWASRGGVPSAATRAAQYVLKHYTKTGELLATDTLLTLGSAVLMSPSLVFLGKYCEFHHLYNNREFKAAGALLISLFKSKITPAFFWSSMLMDTLPMLESDGIIFNSVDTFEIMRCLEIYGEDLKDTDKVDMLRLALVRNLARALVNEKQDIEND